MIESAHVSRAALSQSSRVLPPAASIGFKGVLEEISHFNETLLQEILRDLESFCGGEHMAFTL